MNAWLSQLRQLLHEPPSAEGWFALLDHLEERRGAEGYDLGLDYALEHLDRAWPDHLRVITRDHLPEEDLAAASPTVQLARGLLLDGVYLDDEAVEALLRLPLEPLDALSLGRCHIGAGSLREILAAPWARGLRHLDLDGNAIHDAGLQALALSDGLDQLEHLNLASNGVGDLGLIDWTRAAHHPRLQHLDLSYNRVSADGLDALASSPAARPLTHLLLTGNPLGPAAAWSLTDLDAHLDQLTWLDLAVCRLSDEGADQLIRSPLAARLTHLDLSDNQLTADAAHAFTRPLTTDSPRLTHLALANNPLGPEGIALLADSPGCAALTTLSLRDVHSGLRDVPPSDSLAALDALLASPHLGRLADLDLSINPFGDPGAHLIAAVDLPHLRRLDLTRTNITSNGVQALANAPGLAALTELRLDINRHIGRWGHRALVTSPHLSHELKFNHLARLHVRPLADLAEDLQLNHRGALDKARLLSLLREWLTDTG